VFDRELPGEAWAVRGRIGMLAHEPMLYRELSARENLLYHARLHALPLARVSEMLERVGMGHRADEPLRTLSRGMVQRVAIARAVLHDPELLLLDEPYAHLDPAARELVDPLLCGEGGRTRVISSHDPTGGLQEADLVLGLRAGRVAVLRERAAVRSSELAELYR
jgi:heme exporter protein A